LKGTIVSAWVETCRALYGDNVTNDALEHFQIAPNRIFTPTEDIEDRIAKGIIDVIAKKVGITSDQLWRNMGTQNIMTYSKIYPAFFRYKNLYSFLQAMYDIHVVVTKRIPGANPPILGIYPVSKHVAHMTYASQRGMFPYFHGMLEGAAKYFKEDIEVEVLEKTADFTKIGITFPEEIYYEKRFFLNNLLSFGFIKNMEGKIAISSLLLVGIPAVLINKYMPGNLAMPIILGLSLAIPFIIGKGLFRPIKSIEESLDRVIDKDLSLAEGIVTNDFFENITRKIGLMKDSIKTDFVGYKATTDELNVFTEDFLEISESMSFTSNEISNVVEQMAEGIVSQAEETSGAAEKLNSSINSLEKVVSDGNQGKEHLEAAAIQVSDGFDELNATSDSLSNILREFSQVRIKGQQLQNRANEVRDIVDAVEKIAEQTNLLALNASIEASRAGEYGRGFAVVAMEIRNLAEGSKEAVQTINDNLESFVENIDEFVHDISDQYNILEKENNKLSSIAEENHNSVESINEVSRLIIQLTSELNNNAKEIGSISQGIATLASIAETNSASSEEVSANVHSYTNEIQKMTDGILEFQRVSSEFSKDLEKFVV